MKIFRFLKGHMINLVIALVLLAAQANCELTLPGLMSDIVDVGISQDGIESPVPDKISATDLDKVELFLTDREVSDVEASFSAPASDGIRTFTGTDSDRTSLAGPMSEAEMLVYQFDQGVPVSDVADALGSHSSAGSSAQAQVPTAQLEALFGDTIDTTDLAQLVQAGAISREELTDARASIVQSLGDTGESMVESRAIAYVKQAYEQAGVDLNEVQSAYLFRQGAEMLAFAFFSALCAILAAFNASKTSAAIARDLRHDLYERVLDFSPAEMNRFSAASLITRATNDIQQIQMVLVMCMRIVLFAPCMALARSSACSRTRWASSPSSWWRSRPSPSPSACSWVSPCRSSASCRSSSTATTSSRARSSRASCPSAPSAARPSSRSATTRRTARSPIPTSSRTGACRCSCPSCSSS